MTDRDSVNKVIAGVGQRRRLINGRDLILLASGYPVNYVGESVPDEEIGFILALLQQGALWLAQNANKQPAGFVDVPADLQQEIDGRHDQLLGKQQPAPLQKQTAPIGRPWFRKCLDWIKGLFQ